MDKKGKYAANPQQEQKNHNTTYNNGMVLKVNIRNEKVSKLPAIKISWMKKLKWEYFSKEKYGKSLPSSCFLPQIIEEKGLIKEEPA